MSYANYANGPASATQRSQTPEFYAVHAAASEAFCQAIDSASGLGHHLLRWALVKMRVNATVSELSALDDHTLRDVGIERGHIRQIARRLAENSVAGY
jgi:uncharacterized protein YjiS (DUF1127 family)